MKKTILENKEVILLTLLLIPLFKPVGLTYYEGINIVFQTLKIISLCIMIYCLIKERKLKKYSYLVYLIVFWIIYIINSFISNGNYWDILNNAITSIILIAFLKKEFDNNKNNLFKALKIIFNTYLVLYVFSVVIVNITHIGIFDSENGTTYFLGKDNYSAFIALPMVIISVFIDYIESNKITWKSIIAITIITLCYLSTQSYTASVALLSFLAFIILLKFKINLLKLISIRNVTILLAIVLVLITVFNIQNIFEGYLNSIGKGTSLNSRTDIWEAAIKLIKAKPLLGHGDLSVEHINAYYLYGTTHAHNMILELLLRTGIIGTICYAIFVDKSVKNIYKRGKTSIEISILILGTISYIILSFMDFYPILQYQYCLLGILYCYSISTNAEIDDEIKHIELE